MFILALGRRQKKREREEKSSRSKIGRKQKKEIPNQKSGKRKRRKFPNKEWEKAKKKRKFSIKDRKKTDEICRKVFGPDNI